MSKPSADPAERLVRQIHEALQKQSVLLAKHTRQLESLDAKLDRVLEMLADQAVEFEDDDELDDVFALEHEPNLDELMAEIEKLSPEDLKRQLAQAISIIKAEEKGEGEDDEGDGEKP